MSNFLSSGKDIQLHGFPSLQTKFNLKHVSEPRKFSIFPNENIIVSLYRDNRIGLFQAYQSTNGSDQIKRIKKLKLDGVTCASVLSYDGKHEIAMGLTNGNIEFVDFNTKSMLQKKFSADVFGNGVSNIEFNKDYDVLASTFQSGELQLYSLKNFRKLQRHRLDMKSDIVRFHPTNPHLLAVSSLSGGLTVLNINIKRTTYTNPKVHKQYSADITWLPSSPSTLISVGGTTMKVFDTRQNITVSVTDNPYSYSTIALSPDEMYCCAGDVKGSITSYDLRNIRTVLQTNSCHDGIVTHLRFLPCSLEAELSTEDNLHEEDSDMDSIDRKKVPNRRTSMQNFFDIVAPVKQQKQDADIDSTKNKKTVNRRTSAQDFFDIVAPAKQEKQDADIDSSNNKKLVNRRASAQDFFDVVAPTQQQCDRRRSSGDAVQITNVEATKMVSNGLNTVPEERTMSESSNSNNQTSMDTDASEDQFNSHHTVGSSEMHNFEQKSSNNVFISPNYSTPQVNGNPFKNNASAHYNAAVMSEMNEMSETFEEKLLAIEMRLNDKLMSMERKFEVKLEEMKEELQEQILHGFRSIHCNLWTVAETDVRDTKNMVAKIHENYSKIEDVFIENVLLKEQLLKMKAKDLENSG